MLRKKISISELFHGAFIKLRNSGYQPNIIIFHSGWWGLTYVHRFPHSRLAAFAEWWFEWDGPLSKFDPCSPYNPPLTINSKLAERYNNLTQASELAESDFIWTATDWQKSQFPSLIQCNMHVVHEGIDVDYFHPVKQISHDEFIITYTTRGFEPIRAFEHFTSIVCNLLLKFPNLSLIIVGKDKPAYSPIPPNQDSLGVKAKKLFSSSGLDSRVQWLSRLSYENYKKLLQKSDLHFYFSRPFVASWSLLEAMSCGCCIVASDISMVRELGGDSLFYVNHLDCEDSVQRISHLI